MRDRQQPTNGDGHQTGVRKLRDAQHVDVAAERAFLGGCLLKPDLIMSSGVVAGDFFSEQLGIIWSAILHVYADGEHVDTDTVRAHLDDRGKLASIGGVATLLDLTDAVPDGDFPARRIRKLARRRALDLAARRVVHGLSDDDSAARALAAFDVARAELDQHERGPAVPTLAECYLAMRNVGQRLTTGIVALDDATRGGIPLGRFVSVLGAPGANKTNFCAYLADRFERAGCAVCFVAADESRDSVLVRLAQLAGYHRDAVEEDHVGAREACARDAMARHMLVVDPREDRVTLEDCERLLVAAAGDRPRVLLVDSVQKVKCTAAAQCENKREEIDAVVDVLDKMVARGTLIVAISEMSRAGYRSGNKAQDISALAASAESRAVEYASHLLLGLRGVKGERGVVDLEVAKNRLGNDKPEIRIALDLDKLTWTPVEQTPDDPTAAEVQAAALMRERVLEAARRHPSKSINALGRHVVGNRTAKLAMVRELIEEGALSKVGGVIRVALDGGSE